MKSRNEIDKRLLGCCVFQCFLGKTCQATYHSRGSIRPDLLKISETKQLIFWFYVSKMAMLSKKGCFCSLINGTKRAFWLAKVDWINLSFRMLIFYTYRWCLGSFALEITRKGLWIVVSAVSQLANRCHNSDLTFAMAPTVQSQAASRKQDAFSAVTNFTNVTPRTRFAFGCGWTNYAVSGKHACHVKSCWLVGGRKPFETHHRVTFDHVFRP